MNRVYFHNGMIIPSTGGALVMFDEADACVKRLTAERDALQQRLNAVEEENDRLLGHVLSLCAGANAEMHESWRCTSYHPLLVRAVSDAETALEKRS